jgi:hypothetical protein
VDDWCRDHELSIPAFILSSSSNIAYKFLAANWASLGTPEAFAVEGQPAWAATGTEVMSGRVFDPPGRRHIEPDPRFYGTDNFTKPVQRKVCAGPEQDMSAVWVIGQLGLWFDLERDLVEGAETLEDDFEVDVKVAGQFVGPASAASQARDFDRWSVHDGEERTGGSA